MKRTLVFDTETTDLVANSLISDTKQPHLIEFYGCVVDDGGKLIEELEFLCDPGVVVTEEITRITGIKTEDVFKQPKFKERAKSVWELIRSCDSVVAHNLAFDMSVIDIEMKRIGMQAIWPKRRICTVEETEWFKGYRLNLNALHEHLFGEKFEGAHRAKVDVTALVRCFNELRIRGDV